VLRWYGLPMDEMAGEAARISARYDPHHWHSPIRDSQDSAICHGNRCRSIDIPERHYQEMGPAAPQPPGRI
jgi:hypothetical protein